jgi:hypothetical protein
VRARAYIRQTLAPCLTEVHSTRLDCVVDLADALLSGGRLTAVGLARSIDNDVADKHKIKRVDRLLGNWRLHAEIPLFCAAIARLLLRKRRPLILIDWTDLSHDQVALVAAVPIGGRALPIYFETHPLSRLSNPKVEREFLWVLKQRVVPPGCRPIVISDVGFKTPFFRVVAELGWDFLGRLAGNILVAAHDKRWSPVASLFRGASLTPEDLGSHAVAKGNPLTARLVRQKKLPMGRHGSRRVSRKGVHSGSLSYKKCRHRAKDPWVLITSMQNATAHEIARMYSRRMEIEEIFRDQKSHRFGWSLQDARSRNVKRLQVLLLMACIALFVQLGVGLLAEQSGLHRLYQANTVRDRRVLSLFMLGGLVLASRRALLLLDRLRRGRLKPLHGCVGDYSGLEP